MPVRKGIVEGDSPGHQGHPRVKLFETQCSDSGIFGGDEVRLCESLRESGVETHSCPTHHRSHCLDRPPHTLEPPSRQGGGRYTDHGDQTGDYFVPDEFPPESREGRTHPGVDSVSEKPIFDSNQTYSSSYSVSLLGGSGIRSRPSSDLDPSPSRPEWSGSSRRFT